MVSEHEHETDSFLAHAPQVGEQAPDFVLDTPDGGKLRLVDLTADRTLIIFARHLG